MSNRIPYTQKAIDRFWSLVDIGNPDECWIWKGGKIQRQYGQIYFRCCGKRKPYLAHRVSLSIKLGRQLKPKEWALHDCRPHSDNPSCVNPAHLFVGNVLDNNRDKVRKGRQPRGSSHGRTHLTEDQVRLLKLKHRIGMRSARQLAKEFGLSSVAVNNIVNGKTWKHVVLA